VFINELELPEPWELVKTAPEDLLELGIHYEHISGGLMLNALGLETDMMDHESVSREYSSAGFKKERHLFSLRKSGKLKALVVVNISDIGMNLSDLINCFYVIIIEPQDLPRKTLYLTLSLLFIEFEQKKMPVLLYPTDYADRQSIEYEKLYNLWVLNLQHLDDYFRYIKRLMRFV